MSQGQYKLKVVEFDQETQIKAIELKLRGLTNEQGKFITNKEERTRPQEKFYSKQGKLQNSESGLKANEDEIRQHFESMQQERKVGDSDRERFGTKLKEIGQTRDSDVGGKLQSLFSELVSLENRIQDTRRRMSDIQSQISRADSQMNSTDTTLEEQNKLLSRKMSLEGELRDARNSIEYRERDKRDLYHNSDILLARRTTLINELSSLNHEERKLAKKINGYTKKEMKLENKIKQRIGRIEACTAKTEDTQFWLIEIDKEIVNLAKDNTGNQEAKDFSKASKRQIKIYKKELKAYKKGIKIRKKQLKFVENVLKFKLKRNKCICKINEQYEAQLDNETKFIQFQIKVEDLKKDGESSRRH